MPRTAIATPVHVSTNQPYYTLLPNMTLAQLLLEYLALEGVTKVFGIPGATIIAIMNQLEKQQAKFDFVVCRQETGAAYMADGFARVTGGLGVVMTTSGPAASNALTGSMNAQASGIPLLTITGEVPTAHFGQGFLQEGIDARLDISQVYANAVGYSEVISNADHFTTLLQQALRTARSVPCQAAHLSLPNDVASSCAMPVAASGPPPQISFPASPERYRATTSCSDRAQLEKALDSLIAAHRPLIFLGNGSRIALQSAPRLAAFTALVDRFAIPVMTTPDAKGVFPESHAMSLRNYGMTACEWPDLYMSPPGTPGHYDALLVLGSSLGELATSVLSTDQYSKTLIPTDHFIQVDINPAIIGRDFPVTHGIVAELGAAIDDLCAIGTAAKPDTGAVSERRAFIARLKADNSPFYRPDWRASEAAPINPSAVVRVINEVVRDGHIFIDAGNCVGWGLNSFVIDPPLRFQIALAMGPMGFAVSAVVGGKLGAPDKTCVALVGDGGFLMHGSEISTAAQNQVGAIWVVLNDNDLAMVSQGMAQLYPPPAPWNDYYKLGRPDLVKYAEGLGADAVAITEEQGPAEFRAALDAAAQRAQTARKPQVIVAHIDPVPMPNYGWPTVPDPGCSK
jgi:acetolactate synthase-1/2/3 large subunit